MVYMISAPRVDILGIQFHNVTRAETAELIEQMIVASRPRMVCTPNADHIVRAQHDEEFRRVITNADLVVADGMGVVYASRFLGTPLKENVGGRLLLPEFAARAARHGYRLFLLGGRTNEVAWRAAERLQKENFGLVIAGIYTPPFMHEFDEAQTLLMLETIHQAQPDVLFVCLGTPKQEKWIARNLHRLNVPVSIGVGAALDIVAGQVHEPPRWVSNAGLEWLVKLIQEPRRLWRRYLLGIPQFLWLVLRQRLELRTDRSH